MQAHRLFAERFGVSPKPWMRVLVFAFVALVFFFARPRFVQAQDKPVDASGRSVLFRDDTPRDLGVVSPGKILRVPPKTFQELIERIAIEREKLVQFSVECTLTGSLELLGFPNVGEQARAVVTIEYCRPEQHYLVNITKGNVTSFRGTTGQILISGDSDKIMTLSPKSFMQPLRAHQTPLIYFDPRVTGITSVGDTKRSTSFESAISNFLAWKSDAKREVKLTRDGLLHFEHPDSDLELIVDSKDYWPTYFCFDPHPKNNAQIWNVELAEVHGMRLPCFAELQYNGKSLTIQYSWNQVNQPVVAGDVAAQRIAELYNVAIERPLLGVK